MWMRQDIGQEEKEMNYYDYKRIIYFCLGAGFVMAMMLGVLLSLLQPQAFYESLLISLIVLMMVCIFVIIIAQIKLYQIKKMEEEEWENGQS